MREERRRVKDGQKNDEEKKRELERREVGKDMSKFKGNLVISCLRNNV